MKIIQATENDLVEVLYLLKECVEDLNENGLKHWNNAYPGSDIMIQAIKDKNLYLYRENGVVKGMVVLSNQQPEEYNGIDWKGNPSKVLIMKFLAIHPQWHKQGVVKSLFDYAELFAKENNYTSMRIDIHSGITDENKLYEELGFSKAGQFHSAFQTAPYFAYEKSI